MVFSAINKQGLHEMRELIAGVFDDIPLKTD
jgi:hypothetical protein